jgi:hypothetical protein
MAGRFLILDPGNPREEPKIRADTLSHIVPLASGMNWIRPVSVFDTVEGRTVFTSDELADFAQQYYRTGIPWPQFE